MLCSNSHLLTEKNLSGLGSTKYWLTLVCTATLLLMAGCTTSPGKDEGAEQAALAEGEQVPFVLIPSPYQSGSVPGQAKKEFAAAQASMREKQWDQAEATLLLMTETYPELSGPYVNLGIVYLQTQRYEEAVKALEFAIATNPTNMDAYSQLGLAYREQGLFEQADMSYQSALSVWPHHADSLKNSAILYDLYLGKLPEALERYKLLAQIQGEPTRELKGWIIDLERRIANGDD